MKRRAPCFRCDAPVRGTYLDRPLCQGCRRELMGLPREGATRREYFRVHKRRQRAAWSDE